MHASLIVLQSAHRVFSCYHPFLHFFNILVKVLKDFPCVNELVRLLAFLHVPVMTFAMIIVVANQSLSVTNVNKTVAYAFWIFCSSFYFPDTDFNDIAVWLALLVLKNNLSMHGMLYLIFKLFLFNKVLLRQVFEIIKVYSSNFLIAYYQHVLVIPLIAVSCGVKTPGDNGYAVYYEEFVVQNPFVSVFNCQVV